VRGDPAAGAEDAHEGPSDSPAACCAALAQPNGQAAEVGTIGNEGLVGLPLVFGDDRAPTSVYVQVPGVGLRMKATLFKKELARSASMRTVTLHYAHAFFN
jgi:hypothetical protein